MKETKFLGYDISIPEPADPEDALVPDYGRYLDHIKQAEKDFVRTMEKFFNHTLKDEGLEKAAKDWERAGVILAGYAESLFNAFKDNDDLRRYALELLDKVTKASGARLTNLTRRRDRVLAGKPDDPEEERRLTKAKQEADCGLMRAMNTQARYKDLYEKGESYKAAIHKEEAEISARAAEMRKLIPAGHLHIPGRIYPPIPIPEEQPVPDAPLPYRLYKEAPVEALRFDTDLDEFVLKPGYVSPDGLIDEHSVVWDRVNHQVIMKLRGGEPVIWPEWKATWAGDLPEEDSLAWDYIRRQGRQMREDRVIHLFERSSYEDEEPLPDITQ